MKLQFLILLFVPVLILSLSCKPKVNSENTVYPLKAIESTGITTYVRIHGENICITFHKNSNKHNMKLLMALRWYILFPNSDPKTPSNIYILGKLHDKVMSTEKCDTCPEQEKYHEFELDDWYIQNPFKEITYNGATPDTLMDDPDKIKIIERNSLTIKDFKYFKGIESYNLDKYVRK